MTVASRIREKLEAAFEPGHLEITDESHLHAGHAGARPEGETHFRIAMSSTAFGGQSRVANQRAVYAVLAAELAGPVHALSLDLRAIPEATR